MVADHVGLQSLGVAHGVNVSGSAGKSGLKPRNPRPPVIRAACMRRIGCDALRALGGGFWIRFFGVKIISRFCFTTTDFGDGFSDGGV
jgi:hypothetical protein